MQVQTDQARTRGGDLCHRLATPTAKLRLYAKTLAQVLPDLLTAREAQAATGAATGAPTKAESLPPELQAILPDLPARLGRLADEIDAIVADLRDLPGTRPADAPQAAVPGDTAAPTGAPRPGAPGRRPGLARTTPRVLLVEDDADSADLMCLALQRQGWEVAQAGDGRPALELLGRERFDLILMDCRLPEVDGWDATARLRATGPNRATPVIGLTASPDAAERARGLAVGMDDWIVKPLTGAHLADLQRLYLTPAPAQP